MIALLSLLAVTILASGAMMSVNVTTKITGHELRSSQALNTAEAGVSEAISRIRSGEVPNNGDPAMVAQIFLAAPGNLPTMGADTVAIATAQPAGRWLDYSTAAKSPDVLTVEYKTNSARTKIYRYDPAMSPAIQTTSGTPIYVIRATGRSGQDVRRVLTEVMLAPLNIDIKAAVTADVDVKFSGNAVACGYNHRRDTPNGSGDGGRGGNGGCNEDPTVQEWEIGAGDRIGIWTTKDINGGGGSQSSGAPAEQEGQTGFYAGPWQALGMSQAHFYGWIGPAQSDEPGNLDGIVHLDDNTTKQDRSGAFWFHGGTGSGLLYVDGDLTINGGFTYRGLIYVEGDVKLNGHAWILGGLIVRGKTELKNNGGATTLYSYDAIQESLSRFGGKFVPLSWREAGFTADATPGPAD
jgi:Tfp pilus assembly protein PilX